MPVLALCVAGCVAGCAARPGPATHATLRRTEYGVVHVTAADPRSVAAGLGFAEAQDAVCILADQLLKVRSERALYFGRGAGGANVESDFTYLALGLRARAAAAYPTLTPALRDALDGFVTGYNHYLAVTSPARLPAPCTGAVWVKPIDAIDLLAYHLDLSLLDSLTPLHGYIAGAHPPDAVAPAAAAPQPAAAHLGIGSNGWAIGRERSAHGGGMLLANPHFPWEGALRFYESHLVIPGQLDVYGASLLGVPAIQIGFNRRIAWTHTVASSIHFTAYRLRLAPGNPTAYVYDGRVRSMTAKDHAIRVRDPDGSITAVTRRSWSSHYGPMLGGPGAPWTRDVAYTVRDANLGNVRFAEQWLAMNRAASLADLDEADRRVRGVPWVNTIAVSADGSAMLVDASRVPDLGADTVEAFRASAEREADTKLLAERQIVLLDGSTSRDEWRCVGCASEGLAPIAAAPRLTRTDFVMNANDPPIYANPTAPLRGLPLAYTMYGLPRGLPSTRTHMNLTLLTERGSAGDGRISLAQLQAAITDNRSWVAEKLRAAVAERCTGHGAVEIDGATVPITEACGLLARWDGRFLVDRRGAIVWRELMAQLAPLDLADRGALFAEPFDPAHPLTTPRGLAPPPATGPDPVLVALARAVVTLQRAAIALDAPLGAVQWARRGNETIPVPGGRGFLEGIADVVSFEGANFTLLPQTEAGTVLSPRTGLTSAGYPVNNGSSFILAVAFEAGGPRAVAVLVSSQAADPASPHFADQTRLFSQQRFRAVRFDESEIRADPTLVTTSLDIAPPPAPGPIQR